MFSGANVFKLLGNECFDFSIILFYAILPNLAKGGNDLGTRSLSYV